MSTAIDAEAQYQGVRGRDDLEGMVWAFSASRRGRYSRGGNRSSVGDGPGVPLTRGARDVAPRKALPPTRTRSLYPDQPPPPRFVEPAPIVCTADEYRAAQLDLVASIAQWRRYGWSQGAVADLVRPWQQRLDGMRRYLARSAPGA